MVKFTDPNSFIAGQLGHHTAEWKLILADHPDKDMLLEWVNKGVDVYKFITPFKGKFRGNRIKVDFPEPQVFVNNVYCKSFVKFIASFPLWDRLETGAI